MIAKDLLRQICLDYLNYHQSKHLCLAFVKTTLTRPERYHKYIIFRGIKYAIQHRYYDEFFFLWKQRFFFSNIKIKDMKVVARRIINHAIEYRCLYSLKMALTPYELLFENNMALIGHLKLYDLMARYEFDPQIGKFLFENLIKRYLRPSQYYFYLRPKEYINRYINITRSKSLWYLRMRYMLYLCNWNFDYEHIHWLISIHGYDDWTEKHLVNLSCSSASVELEQICLLYRSKTSHWAKLALHLYPLMKLANPMLLLTIILIIIRHIYIPASNFHEAGLFVIITSLNIVRLLCLCGFPPCHTMVFIEDYIILSIALVLTSLLSFFMSVTQN